MKNLFKMAMVVPMAATGLALAGCDSPAENAMEDQAEMVDETAEAQADAMHDAADEMGGAAGEAMEDKADAVEEAGEAKKDAMEEQADNMDAAPQ